MDNSSVALINLYIKRYKKLIFIDLYNELYKWEALNNFQRNWNIDDVIFSVMFDKSFQPKNCNLWSARVSQPRIMMVIFIDKNPEKVREMFRNLFDESKKLVDRVNFFIKESKKMTNEIWPEQNKNSFQDMRIIMLYLSFRFPEKYYLYKYKMYLEFLKITKFSEVPKITRKENHKIIEEYIKMCDNLKIILEQDLELISLHKKRLKDEKYYKDDSNHLLTQDFIYCVTKYLNPEKVNHINNDNLTKIIESNGIKPLNQILFGPPGTGKTFKTKEIAVSIIRPKEEVTEL